MNKGTEGNSNDLTLSRSVKVKKEKIGQLVSEP